MIIVSNGSVGIFKTIATTTPLTATQTNRPDGHKNDDMKTELRLNNLILAPKSDEFDLKICKVFEIRNKHFKLIELGTNLMFDQTRVEGIPLTEKWLEDFGLKKINNKIDIYEIHRLRFWLGARGATLCYLIEENTTTGHYTRTIESVHELQNLIHALTGTELTLNTNPNENK